MLNYLVSASVLIIGFLYLKIINRSYQNQIIKLLNETARKNDLLIEKNSYIEA